MEKNVFSEEINLKFFILGKNTALFESNYEFRIILSFHLNQIAGFGVGGVDGIQLAVGVAHGGNLFL